MLPFLSLSFIWHTKVKAKSDWSVKHYMRADYNTITAFVNVMWKYKVLSKHEWCMINKMNALAQRWGRGCRPPGSSESTNAISYIISDIISYHYHISYVISFAVDQRVDNIWDSRGSKHAECLGLINFCHGNKTNKILFGINYIFILPHTY